MQKGVGILKTHVKASHGVIHLYPNLRDVELTGPPSQLDRQTKKQMGLGSVRDAVSKSRVKSNRGRHSTSTCTEIHICVLSMQSS